MTPYKLFINHSVEIKAIYDKQSYNRNTLVFSILFALLFSDLKRHY